MRILTVEDDELLAQAMAHVLAQQHYAVDVALDGKTGWQFAIATNYDLILLDVMLPQLDGVSLCRQLRQEGYQVPILLLTAKDSCIDKVNGLDAGADDYVIKPVNFDELTARIRALLRRGSTASPLLTWAALSLDPGSLEVTYNHQPLHLTATEYRLLELFLRNPRRVFSRSAIVEHLWTFDDQPEASTVKTYIKNLRQKLKLAGAPTDLIETVYGLGYQLKSDPNHSGVTGLSFPKPVSPSAEQSLKTQQTLLAVAQARDNFKSQIRDRLRHLKKAIGGLEAGSLSTELHKQAIYEAHRFAGALGTFGFTTASQLAEAVEDLLQIQPLNFIQIQQLRQLVDELAQTLEPSLIQTTSITASNPAHPQLLVVSKDIQWVRTLTQTACTHLLTIKSLSGTAGKVWVEQTFHLIQGELPDAVLLDLEAAPTPQVMSLLTELSERLSIPVLVITENDSFDHRIEAARRGGYRFLLKTTPIDRVLEQVIQTLQCISTEKSRILIVNARQTLEIIRDILEPWGLQLKLLADPQQFWQTLVVFSPDLLILDAEMPDLCGIDLCRVVRTDPTWSRLPILFLTSHNDAETIHRLFSIGADDWISKPIAGAKLLTQVLNRLAREQAH
jgi:DNA-binding response OmpR family regulator